MLKLKHVLIALLFFTLTLAGCSKPSQEPVSISSFKLNTVIHITLYDTFDPQLLQDCVDFLDRYELLFSRTNPESELYQLNHGTLTSKEHGAVLSEETIELIHAGIDYSKLSEGRFDISMAPLTDLWDFTASSPKVPSDRDIQRAASLVNYKDITFSQNRLYFNKENMGIDAGAIAKGFIADKIKEYLVSKGVKSAIINLGGNVLCIGQRPDGRPFKIGIQKPFANQNETIATLDITDKSVVSSGIYERYFQQDGKLYHHILNPETGYPYDNDLAEVTIITDKSVDGDGLSTCCFALGLEAGMDLVNSLDHTDGIFITKDGKIYYSDELAEKYNLTFTNETMPPAS